MRYCECFLHDALYVHDAHLDYLRACKDLLQAVTVQLHFYLLSVDVVPRLARKVELHLLVLVRMEHVPFSSRDVHLVISDRFQHE